MKSNFILFAATFSVAVSISAAYAESGVLVSKSDNKRSQAPVKLVSASADQNTQTSTQTQPIQNPSYTNPNAGKITLKFVPKEREKKPASNLNYSSLSEDAQKIYRKTYQETDSYQFNKTKFQHPASTKPDATNPIKETVGAPVTLNYSKPRYASVLDSGKQKSSSGSASVTGRVTTAAAPQSS